MREGARRLARPRRRVDPALVEEALADRGQLRREGAIGPARLAAPPARESAVVIAPAAARCGPSSRAVHAEPVRLQPVIAMRELGDRRRAPPRPARRRPRPRPDWRGCASETGRGKSRQRSSISLSLASVLVISAKRRACVAEHRRRSPAAASRWRRRGRTAGSAPRSTVSSLPLDGKRMRGDASRRTAGSRPRGRRPISRAAASRARRRADAGGRRARSRARAGSARAPGVFSFFSSAASSRRLSSSVKNSRSRSRWR